MSDESQLNEHAHGRLADWVAFVVYGSITVLAAVGGLRLEAQSLEALQAAAVLIVVAIAAWLAHSMWRVVRARAIKSPSRSAPANHTSWVRSWPILASGLPGATALMPAAAGAWSVAIGLRVAQGLGVGVLFAAGLVTVLPAGATRSRQLTYVIALPTVGLVIVVLEVAAHEI